MRRLLSLAAMLLIVMAACLPLAADSAHSNYNKGVDAEKRQDYERAFEYFQEAFRQKPKELRYRTAYEHTKFLAAAAHVHRGQLLRDAGKFDEAIVEFQKASAVDPSSFIAQQELRRTQELLNQSTNPPQAVAAPPSVLRRRLAEAQGPVELTAISNVPITLKSTEDTKVIYEIVGKLAGINVLFDPDYTSRKIRIDLNGVTLEEALGIIALESKTFWRPVTPNTIFVA
ncbi:MAG TPA: tetratricopeptide repeat protein, partial [Terriglobales bacterium]|nr:tetratricopeptide repeat protein [Terriglobales bacterium]